MNFGADIDDDNEQWLHIIRKSFSLSSYSTILNT